MRLILYIVFHFLPTHECMWLFQGVVKKAVFILKAWIGFRSKGGDQFGVSFFQGILDVCANLNFV